MKFSAVPNDMQGLILVYYDEDRSGFAARQF
jgi:hypothetical protein